LPTVLENRNIKVRLINPVILGISAMMKPTLYLETTVPSYLVSQPSRDLVVAAHQQITNEWWAHQREKFDIYISQFVFDEARAGDTILAGERMKIISKFPKLEVNQDVKYLAALLIRERIIPAKAVIDAAHIAVSAVHGMEFLLTWNCAHLANAVIAKRIQKVCLDHGFLYPVICTPEELMGV